MIILILSEGGHMWTCVQGSGSRNSEVDQAEDTGPIAEVTTFWASALKNQLTCTNSGGLSHPTGIHALGLTPATDKHGKILQLQTSMSGDRNLAD